VPAKTQGLFLEKKQCRKSGEKIDFLKNFWSFSP